LADAYQEGLISFVNGMRIKPKHIVIVLGDEQAKVSLTEQYKNLDECVA